MVELSVLVTDPPMGGASRPFSFLLSTKDGTASKTVLLSITYVDAFLLLGSSEDYKRIKNEVLQFNTGDERVSYSIVVNDDSICERTSQEFFLELSLHSGALPITISQSKARITINSDSIDTDCSKLLCYA